MDREINTGKSVVIHAVRGKLQELMSVVSSSTEIANTTHFYSSQENIDVSKVYKMHADFEIRDILRDNDEKGDEYRNGINPFVEFSEDVSMVVSSSELDDIDDGVSNWIEKMMVHYIGKININS